MTGSRQETAPICEYSASYFVDAAQKCKKLDELIELFDNPPVVIETVHDKMNFKSNGFKGVFFRLAFLKYISNVNNVEARTRGLNFLVKIFPFKIEPSLSSLADNIIGQLDNSFQEELRDFLRTHFDDFNVDRFHDVVDNFLSNIVHFCGNHFVSDAETKAFCQWVESGFWRSLSFDTQKHENALKQIPRLNCKGAKRYAGFFKVYNEVARFYGRKTLPIPEIREFRYLLEKNIYDLSSLIDETFCVENKVEYENRFKKYFLFFMYSTLNGDGEDPSVFFIDDCLFECAKALTTYRKRGTDPAAMKFEMSLHAILERRRQPHDGRGIGDQSWFQIDDQELVKMKRVAESYPKIETARMHEMPKNEILKYTSVYLRTDDDMIDFYLSSKSRRSIREFLYLFVTAALYKHVEFKHLVIYNALLGQKTSVEITPEKQRKVYDFIVKYNSKDAEREFLPSKRLVWGFEDCFVDASVFDCPRT